MRPQQKSNRSRGKNNRKSVGNNINRVYESTGPEGKVRGTPQQIIDKYLALARDAQTSDNRVVAENFLQHAEHYSRILTSVQAAAAERRDAQPSEPREHGYGQDGQGGGDEPYGEAQADHRDDYRDGHRDDQRADHRPAQQGGPAPIQADARRPEALTAMATIDTTDGEDGPELVATPESRQAEAPTPRRRRSRRRRRRRVGRGRVARGRVGRRRIGRRRPG